MDATMLKIVFAALALGLTEHALAQTAAPTQPVDPATPSDLLPPANPARAATPMTGAGVPEALPSCSAQLRGRCLRDERFATDRWTPGPSRDNNAMRYETSEEAARSELRRRIMAEPMGCRKMLSAVRPAVCGSPGLECR
jgi:hypothetical protein